MIDVRTDFGIFRFETYELNGTGDGMRVVLTFVPGLDVDATKLGLVQVASARLRGEPFIIGFDPVVLERSIPRGEPFEGAHIDQPPTSTSPVYGRFSEAPGPAALDAGQSDPELGRLGRRTWEGGVVLQAPAELRDAPAIIEEGDCEQIFETACLALTGAQAGRWYGSVTWGWRRTAGQAQLRAPEPASRRGASPMFRRAAGIWNGSRTQDGTPTIPLPLPDLG